MRQLAAAIITEMKTHESGDCSFCGGTVRAQKAELDYRHKGKLYIFEKVPVGVCGQCGEKYLTSQVAEEIERRIQAEEKWDKTRKVPVQVYSQTA